MMIFNTESIVINPSNPDEYRWWFDNRDRLLEERYKLFENSTLGFKASKEFTYFIEVKREEV